LWFCHCSALTFSTNIVAAELVKYTEKILCQVWNKYFHTIFIRSSLKSNFSKRIHNDFISIKDNVSNKIGGGHHRNHVEKIEMESVSPYIESAPLNYLYFKTCEFVEHLEMSEALIKYNTSVYMMCNIPVEFQLATSMAC
jgi:hypothetical protein